MTQAAFNRHRLPRILLTTCVAFALSQTPAYAENEPIAYIGHGGFFDQQGHQIPLTLEFVASTQDWYQRTLVLDLDARKKHEFVAFEKRLNNAIQAKGQAHLIVQHQLLDWLLLNSPRAQADARLPGKVGALKYALNWTLLERADLRPPDSRAKFQLDPEIARKLKLPEFNPGGVHVLSATVNTGQAYINECMAAGVPIPPTIGKMDPAGLTGWKSQGFIPTQQQFIIFTPAEFRTYQTPDGMCVALPRYSDASKTEVAADGVICLGKATSKVCFWDNQMPGTPTNTVFPFPAGAQIPIGVPDTSIDPAGRYQAGGFDLNHTANGVCTDCHAGENPFIVHPDADLGGGVTMNSLKGPPQDLPMFSVNRYDPLVPGSWPQNDLSQAKATLPTQCVACHVKGIAGRFPLLSNKLPGYCGTIFVQAISGAKATMPQGNPGSAATDAGNFMNQYCSTAPDLTAADAGDPHITTVDGIHYDFQAAGEFTALKNDDTGFELQTRQSPVLTGFTPVPANAYTGLASCVSLNTAVAMRVGKHHITYQSAGDGVANAGRFQMRVDGVPVNPASGYNFGAGNTISTSAGGSEIIVHIDDGTVIMVTPLFWTDQGYWYLDVQAFNTPAREGVMGSILSPEWLPRAPDGASFGPVPASLADRDIVLNQKFADAWRVRNTTSLFDYAPGTSTNDFTDRNWPPPPGMACTKTTVHGTHPTVKKPRPDLARQGCRGIKDKTLFANCTFDVTVMGDPARAKAYQRADKLKPLPKNIGLVVPPKLFVEAANPKK